MEEALTEWINCWKTRVSTPINGVLKFEKDFSLYNTVLLKMLKKTCFHLYLLGWRTSQPRFFQPQASTPDISTPDFSTLDFLTPDFSTKNSWTMGLKSSWLKSLGLKSPGLKCHLSRRLKDISTPDFSTMNFSTPWFKNSWLKSPGLKSSLLKSLGLKGPGLKLGVEKSGVKCPSTITTSLSKKGHIGICYQSTFEVSHNVSTEFKKHIRLI